MTSSYRESAVKRRDERNAKIEVRKPSGSRKNTNRWCRGVVGREHLIEQTYNNLEFYVGDVGERRILKSKVRKCQVCGKEWYGWKNAGIDKS